MSKLTDFAKGIITGALVVMLVFGVIYALMYFHKRDKEAIEYAEKQMEIEAMREDVINRDPVEFLGVPGVRGAVDSANTEFDRKRDEILHRFRNRNTD